MRVRAIGFGRAVGQVAHGLGESPGPCRSCRGKTKNNPVLIGEPGVGKTAVVEGLADGIVKGHDEPDSAGFLAAGGDVWALA